MSIEEQLYQVIVDGQNVQLASTTGGQSGAQVMARLNSNGRSVQVQCYGSVPPGQVVLYRVNDQWLAVSPNTAREVRDRYAVFRQRRLIEAIPQEVVASDMVIIFWKAYPADYPAGFFNDIELWIQDSISSPLTHIGKLRVRSHSPDLPIRFNSVIRFSAYEYIEGLGTVVQVFYNNYANVGTDPIWAYFADVVTVSNGSSQRWTYDGTFNRTQFNEFFVQYTGVLDHAKRFLLKSFTPRTSGVPSSHANWSDDHWYQQPEFDFPELKRSRPFGFIATNHAFPKYRFNSPSPNNETFEFPLTIADPLNDFSWQTLLNGGQYSVRLTDKFNSEEQEYAPTDRDPFDLSQIGLSLDTQIVLGGGITKTIEQALNDNDLTGTISEISSSQNTLLMADLETRFGFIPLPRI